MPYKEDFRRHSKRRKRGHDYRAPWKYHITIAKDPAAPLFSELVIRERNPDGVSVKLSELGEVVDNEIREFELHHPEIRVMEHIVMPDHVHALIQVKRRLAKPVGNAIGGLKSGISNAWRSMTGNQRAVVFEDGFNDRIIYSFRSVDVVKEYIRQNPYRLAIRRLHPEFFQKTRGVRIEGMEMQAYGNMFLLRNPFKFSLVIHRADTEEDFERKKEECLHIAENGGVVVSAFISQREKLIQKDVEEAGGRIIKISDRNLEAREKPARHDFDQCVAGNLLLLSPVVYASMPRREHPSRQQCLEMNRLADLLATGNLTIQ